MESKMLKVSNAPTQSSSPHWNQESIKTSKYNDPKKGYLLLQMEYVCIVSLISACD